MKSFRVVLILLIIPLILCSSTWTRFFEGRTRSVFYDGKNGYVLVGSSTEGTNNEQILILKYSEEGQQIFRKLYGGTGNERILNGLLTADSNYIMCGYTTSSGSGLADVIVMKTDQNGDSLWAKVYGYAGDDTAFSMCQTMDGGYMVVGRSDTFGYMLRLDSLGDTIWTRRNDSLEIVRNVVSDDSGGVEWFICSGCVAQFHTGYKTLYPCHFRLDTLGEVVWEFDTFHYWFVDEGKFKVLKLPDYQYITVFHEDWSPYGTFESYMIIDKDGGFVCYYGPLNENYLTKSDNWPHGLSVCKSIIVIDSTLYSLTLNYDYIGITNQRLKKFNIENDQITKIYEQVITDDYLTLADLCLDPDGSIVFTGSGVIIKTDSLGINAMEEPVEINPVQTNRISYFCQSNEFLLTINSTTNTRLTVFDLNGRIVDIPIDGILNEGRHCIPFFSSISGIYFYRLESDLFTETGKFMVVR